jgi:hypothetical protein
MTEWQNRIVGYTQIAANQLLANPDNPRRHPASQREALRGSLDTLGIVDAVLLNTRTGYLIDGHARVEEALTKDEAMLLPVLEVDISEEEEKIFLASFDWITTLAQYERDSLASLLHDVQPNDTRLQAMLSELASENQLFIPDDFPEYTEEIEDTVEYITCPHCGEQFPK